MAFEKNPDELGALWLKTGSRGEYMTGTINGVKVVCFAAKPSEKGPAWRVLKSKPREEALPHERAAWSSGQPPVTSDDVPF